MEKILLQLCGFSDEVLSQSLRGKIINAFLEGDIKASRVKELLDFAAYGAECNTQCMLVMDAVWQTLQKKELES